MYIDIHSHVIWGVDDGASTAEETFGMLKAAAADGIDTIICTPHMTPGVYAFPEEDFQVHFREAEAFIAAEGLELKLLQGAEILYTDATPRLLREGKIPTLAGSRYAMIEFSPTHSKDFIFNAVHKVAATGLVPVVAHMERYPAIGKLDEARDLKRRFGAMIQINARSLTRKQPFFRRKFFDGLFAEGICDFIATDTHAMEGRETCMTAGMTAAREKFGEGCVKRLEENARRIVGA